METRVVTLSDLEPSGVSRWEGLAQSAVEPNPFLDPRVLAPGGVPNEAAHDMSFMMVEDAGELLGVMAFQLGIHVVRRVPLKALTLGEFPYTPRWYPLVSATAPSETLAEMIRATRRMRLASLMDLENFPADGPLHEALVSATSSLGITLHQYAASAFAYAYREAPAAEATHRPTGTGRPAGTGLPERPAELRLERLSGVVRRHHAKYLRDLERVAGGALTVSDRSGDPAAILEFIDLQASGWKGDTARGGAAFRVTGWAPWFIAITDGFRAAGSLAVYTLSSGVDTIHMQVAVRSGSGLFGLQDAYNEAYREHRPGNLGRLAGWAYGLAETDAEFFDPNVGPSYAESMRLYPDRRSFARYVISTGGSLASAALAVRPQSLRTSAG